MPLYSCPNCSCRETKESLRPFLSHANDGKERSTIRGPRPNGIRLLRRGDRGERHGPQALEVFLRQLQTTRPEGLYSFIVGEPSPELFDWLGVDSYRLIVNGKTHGEPCGGQGHHLAFEESVSAAVLVGQPYASEEFGATMTDFDCRALCPDGLTVDVNEGKTRLGAVWYGVFDPFLAVPKLSGFNQNGSIFEGNARTCGPRVCSEEGRLGRKCRVDRRAALSPPAR